MFVSYFMFVVMGQGYNIFLDNTVLYNRLESRQYSVAKIQENVQCEIMQMIAEEARQSYKEGVVAVLRVLKQRKVKWGFKFLNLFRLVITAQKCQNFGLCQIFAPSVNDRLFQA